MAKGKSPAFQFYPDDFLGSSKVAVMSAQEVGVYLLLLCMDWNDGGIAYNPRLLARYCRVTEAEFTQAWEVVGQCFVERDGRFWNPRLERERDKQAKFSAKQKAAADVRWQSHGNATASGRECSPFPSPSPAPATTGWRKRGNAEQPAPFKTDPFCTKCGGGMGKKNETDTRLTIIHREDCPDA